jgi:DNA-binding NarL/FixJ family response regulator
MQIQERTAKDARAAIDARVPSGVEAGWATTQLGTLILPPAHGRRDPHASGASVTARDPSFRQAAAAVDRARSLLPHEDDHDAIDAWQALVAGRWTVVDYFDSDGRCIVIAQCHENDGWPGLSRRTRQVVARRVLGHSLKVIASELDISIATVCREVARGRAALGNAWLSAAGLRSSTLERDGHRWLVWSFLRCGPALPQSLTEAERAVVIALLGGDSNQDIARKRRTSVHTVANQVSSIFRKLNVQSRAELAFKLTRG